MEARPLSSSAQAARQMLNLALLQGVEVGSSRSSTRRDLQARHPVGRRYRRVANDRLDRVRQLTDVSRWYPHRFGRDRKNTTAASSSSTRNTVVSGAAS